jgi:hypothetical protein
VKYPFDDRVHAEQALHQRAAGVLKAGATS